MDSSRAGSALHGVCRRGASMDKLRRRQLSSLPRLAIAAGSVVALLLGSVASGVVTYANCPVLVVK